MTRLRLFLFYSLMAWASALRPDQGMRMIDDAELGSTERHRRNLFGENGRRPPRPLRTPSGSTLALAATCAILVTGAWLALLIDTAIGWLQ